MSVWSATRAKRVYAALLRLGWTLKKQVGSHRKLQRPGWQNFTFCFHDSEDVGPAALARFRRRRGFDQRIFSGRDRRYAGAIGATAIHGGRLWVLCATSLQR
ncbi:MAG: type II toxin-antitoxin system HicA family toxin [Bryobacteraceae bacterium]|nr:type II toxin-antitoxin system HicA family toxin [Bryobacteraceae bacterium]